MAASIIDQIVEETRQGVTGDKSWFRRMPYAFRLCGPPGQHSLGPLGEAVFPLPLNPDNFEYLMPFSAEISPLQEGGIVSEEQGIVIAEIRISATTGFKLKKPFDTALDKGPGTFTGDLDPGSFSDIAQRGKGISGQMLFWRFASRCFDTYSELKKSSEHAQKTFMTFHSVKDDLHLQVIPREFNLVRDASRDRVTYRWNARLSVVGPAAAVDIEFPSPDEGLLQAIKNGIAQIRNAVQSIKAAVDDLNAAIDNIRRTITSIAGVIDDVSGIVDSFSDLVSGVKKFADIPAAFITATAGLADSAAALADQFSGGASGGGTFPADVGQTIRSLSDNLDKLKVAARDHFKEDFDESARRYESLTEGAVEGKDSQRDTLAAAKKAEADGGQGRLSVTQAFDGVKPGDQARGRINNLQSAFRLKPGQYNGFEERVVGEGDTIQSLAAKHLGDANKWLDLAVVNQLRSPFITNGAMIPGTLRVGDRFVVPISTSRGSANTLTTGAAATGKSQIEQQLGTDFELRRQNDGSFGWAIDVAAGSTDVHNVTGFKNMGQAIEARFRTEQGHNILYPAIGLPRLVGQNAQFNTIVTAEHAAQRQLLADPRVEKIASFKFSAEKDVLTFESDVKLRGDSTTRTIARTLS